MKILGYIAIVFIVLFAFYGFLVLKEYLRYLVRRIHLKLQDKLDKLLPAPADEVE